jgi:GT2 family glycosyltransferase
MPEVDYSFIILSYNSERYLSQCLASIDDSIATLDVSAEVFVVDNGSNDSSCQILDSFKFNDMVSYKVIKFDHNTGTTFSRNAALRQATGKFLVVLDSDAYVNAPVLERLREYLLGNPACGLVVPKLIYPDGRYQLSVDQFPTIVHKIRRFLFLKQMERARPISAIKTVSYAISAFWMFPRHILDRVGLLDEKIFYSPEDVDYCIRIWKAGYKIIYIPDVSTVHDAQEISRSKGFKLLNLFSLSHIKGLFYLYFKHRFIFSGQKFIQ